MNTYLDRFTEDRKAIVGRTRSPQNGLVRGLDLGIRFVETGEMNDRGIVARSRYG
jgi:hypothetical protein